jgi:diguanylate cyclase (GGDEF)-like protein/PAS domain S-box-containing protein
VAFVLIGYALVGLARIAFLVVDPLAPAESWFQAPEEQTLAILVFQMLSIALTFTLILMVTRRLWLDGQEQETVRRRAETRLRESEARLSAVFRASPVGISLTTFPDGRLADVNDAFLSLLGYSRAEFVGRMMPDLAIWLSPEARGEIVTAVREQGSLRDVETHFRRKSGEPIPVLMSVEIINVSGEPHMLTLASDITERKQAEAEIDRLARFPSENPNPVMRVAQEGVISYANNASTLLLDAWGCRVGQALPADWWALAIKAMKGGASLNAEARAGGRVFSLTFAPIAEAGYVNIYGLDITERKQAEFDLRDAQASVEAANQELTHALRREKKLARTDSLTGVFNRRHFFELALHEFAVTRRYRRPLSMIIFDIDYFKQVNDTFGHQVGDRLLKRVAKIAREQLREADILARYGGDEFAVLLPASSARDAAIVAQRIRESVSAFGVDTNEGKASVTISIGIAECTPDGCTLDRLIQEADTAMYAAKEAGRNHAVIFTQE